MAKQAPLLVITANRTADGAVAYLRADNTWSSDLQEAAVIESPEVAQELLALASEQERIVCDPYTMKVAREGDSVVAFGARERIRRDGPTVRLRRPDPTAQPRA